MTPDQISYLDATAATEPGRAYKGRLLEALDVRPGHVVLDLGCGPGTDLPALAEAVGATGRVLGVDRDPVMVERARQRLASVDTVDVCRGDAHAISVPTRSIDRARTDRVLQHVTDPPLVLAELHRVLRTGGVLGMAEPDWDSLAIEDADVETSVAFCRFLGSRVRNHAIGRELPELAERVGFQVSSVDPMPVVIRDPELAETILGLRRSADRAVGEGVLTEAAATSWYERVTAGPFLAQFTVYLVTAVRVQQ